MSTAAQLQDAVDRVFKLMDTYRGDLVFRAPETTPEHQARLLNQIWATIKETRDEREKIEPTEEMLKSLVQAQAKHTAEILTDPHNGFGDDMGDYTCSALDVMRALFEMYWDQVDLEGLAKYLNTPQSEVLEGGYIELTHSGGMHLHLGMCASDGICQELYDLNPIALDWKD